LFAYIWIDLECQIHIASCTLHTITEVKKRKKKGKKYMHLQACYEIHSPMQWQQSESKAKGKMSRLCMCKALENGAGAAAWQAAELCTILYLYAIVPLQSYACAGAGHQAQGQAGQVRQGIQKGRRCCSKQDLRGSQEGWRLSQEGIRQAEAPRQYLWLLPWQPSHFSRSM